MRDFVNRAFPVFSFRVIAFFALLAPFTVTLAEDTSEIIAFTSGRYGEEKNIYVVDIGDNPNPIKLTDSGDNFSFAWSPTGRHIAFVSDRDRANDFQIYVMDSEGSNQTRLTTTGDNLFPSWSPDGEYITFGSQNQLGRDYQIASINVADNHILQLTNLPGSSTYSAWSPDGSYIAFVCHFRESSHQIYVMNSDGSNMVGLYDRGYIEDFISWSTDSRSIAFLSTGENFGSERQIYSISIDGTNLIQLTDTGNNSSPTWSPDGNQIAFASFYDGFQIYVMNTDGSDKTRLTTTGSNRSPAWSPNGERIAFVSDRDGRWQIYVMNADGSNQIRITDPDNGVENEKPAWMPQS